MAASQPSPKRQCWECLRRRLVCDFTQPSCKKCIRAGVECPGYDEKKPLKWLEPGKVASKRRSPKNSQKGKNRASKEPISSGKTKSSTPGTTLVIRDNRGSSSSEDTDGVEEIPRFDLKDETHDVVQAIHYYNERVYPDMLLITELEPNPFIIHFPLRALHYLPHAIHHTMACFAIGHRIHQLQFDEDKSLLTKAWERVYYHRGQAIREISQDIARDESRTTDATVTSVLLLLVTEVLLQQSHRYNWRDHATGLRKLIAMRGGYGKLFQSSPPIRSALVLFMIIGVFSNTTSPAWDQFKISSPLLLIPQVTETYRTIFPQILCPQSLFFDMININQLRAQTKMPGAADEAIRGEAEELLERIEGFSPEQWATENISYASYQEDWDCIGTIYKSAIAIYCILSMQSLLIFPSTPELESKRTAHGNRLMKCLAKGLLSPRLSKFMMWPGMVAGVEAVNRGTTVREIVAGQLALMSKDMGTATPLQAVGVLRKFWASGKTGWDDCFDEPYAIIV